MKYDWSKIVPNAWLFNIHTMPYLNHVPTMSGLDLKLRDFILDINDTTTR